MPEVLTLVVHSYLHTNCHNQIAFAKFAIKIYYPPLYERKVWHFQEADAILVRLEIHDFSWERSLLN